jgi:tetratricopeptide (TPR) repeat protein
MAVCKGVMMESYFMSVSLPWLFGIHAVTAGFTGLLAYGLLHRRYPGQFSSIFSLFFLLAFSLPFIGLPFSLWLAFYFRYHRHDPDELRVQYLELDPFFVEFPKIKRSFGEGMAIEIVANEKIPIDKRIAALTLLAEYRSREHMPVIKNMLASKNDELRLLSFAVIDKLEQDIHKKIHEQKSLLERCADETPSEACARIHKVLAFAYWELIYYELSDETLTRFLLSMIEEHAAYVLEHAGDDAEILALLGKASLKAQKYDAALTYFWKAIKFKRTEDIKDEQYLIPYIAEIYFNQRKYVAVKKLLGGKRFLALNAKMKPIHEIWAL